MNIPIHRALGLIARFCANDVDPAVRGSGTTTALVAAAVASGATLVAATAEHAAGLRRQHPGVSVMSLGEHFIGRHERFLLDHYAVQTLLAAAGAEANRARAEERKALDRDEHSRGVRRRLETELQVAEWLLADARRALAQAEERNEQLAAALRTAEANEGLRKLAAREAG